MNRRRAGEGVTVGRTQERTDTRHDIAYRRFDFAAPRPVPREDRSSRRGASCRAPAEPMAWPTTGATNLRGAQAGPSSNASRRLVGDGSLESSLPTTRRQAAAFIGRPSCHSVSKYAWMHQCETSHASALYDSTAGTTSATISLTLFSAASGGSAIERIASV